MPLPYVKQTWNNGVAGGTPISSARLQYMEDGIDSVSTATYTRVANQQTVNYTFVLGDAGKVIEGNSATALTFTIPPDSSVAFPTHTEIKVSQIGLGAVTVAAGAGVTITGSTVTPGQGGSLVLRKTGTNTWNIDGALVLKTFTQSAVGAEVDLFRVNLATAARGPFRFHVEDGIFNGERDPRLVVGYNQAAEGGLLKAGESAFSWCIEAHYYDGTNRTFESYWQYVGSTGSPVRRPIFIQIIKSTNAMNAFQIRSSGIQFTDWAMAGDVVIAQIANAPAQVGIQHYGRSDQTVDTELVAEAQNGKAGLLKLGAAPGTGGAFQVRRVNNNQWAMDVSGFAGMFEFFGPDGTRMYGSPTFAGLGILSPTDIPTLILVARAAQTTNLLQARASDGTSVLWAITAAGLPKWHAASSVQTTVGAAGTAAAPPANPTKWLKVVGDDNLTYVVAAYAAA